MVDLQVLQQELLRVLLELLDSLLQIHILLVDVHELHVLRRHRILARVSCQKVGILVPLAELLVLHLETFHVSLLFCLGRRVIVVAKTGYLVHTQDNILRIEVVP